MSAHLQRSEHLFEQNADRVGVAVWTSIISFTLLCCVSLGCVSRPLPRKVPVEELIQQAVEKSVSDLRVHTEAEFLADGEVVLSDEVVLGTGVNPERVDFSTIESIIEPADHDGHWPDVDVALDDAPRIDDDFIEMDVREVLISIADETGIDLVLDETVSGIVNTQVNNLSVDDAIEKVLMPLGLTYAKRGNQYIIAPPDPESPLFSYVSSQVEYRALNVPAKHLTDTIPQRLEKYVEVIPESNLIMIDAPEDIANSIQRRFATIDQPVPQVTLEAIICVVEPDSGFQFGLDWQHAVELNGTTLAKIGATGLALSGNYSPAGGRAVFNDFAQTSAFVKLLSEHGYLTIRATPHVMAQDGKEANIAINRETFFSIQPNSSGDNGAFFFQQEIQKVESGITLSLTPRVRGDVVTIDIAKAEVSEDIRNANTELAVNPFPIINRRSVSTTVHVQDGKTIVIGGLVQKETVDRINRIPGLSKLPLLGYLFETTQRQTREAEVVIFISPRIERAPVSVSVHPH